MESLSNFNNPWQRLLSNIADRFSPIEPGSDAMLVTFTFNDDYSEVNADKTFAELTEELENGSLIYGKLVWDEYEYNFIPLSLVSTEDDSVVEFKFELLTIMNEQLFFYSIEVYEHAMVFDRANYPLEND